MKTNKMKKGADSKGFDDVSWRVRVRARERVRARRQKPIQRGMKKH